MGAIEPWDGFTALANYNFAGAVSNDNRIKPDLSAGTCVTTLTTGTGCFGGTSGATPVVAGAAALILGVNPAATPVDVRNYLLTQAVADRGPAGPDNAYGVGELILPALAPPPPPPPPPPVPRNPQAGDRRKPTARAFLSKGVRGSKVRLRYRVFDNSGQTREILQVKRGSKIVRTFHTRYGATGKKGRIYYVSWRSPRARGHKRPAFRFCVQAFDRGRNRVPAVVRDPVAHAARRVAEAQGYCPSIEPPALGRPLVRRRRSVARCLGFLLRYDFGAPSLGRLVIAPRTPFLRPS